MQGGKENASPQAISWSVLRLTSLVENAFLNVF
jgi:hypothetical protein